MALLLRKQKAPSSGRTLGPGGGGAEGLPRRSARAQKRNIAVHHPALWASILHASPVKAFITPRSAGRCRTTQTPAQRPEGREEPLGLTFHPGPLSVCSSWHWSHVLRSHREQHGGGEGQNTALPPPPCKRGPNQELLRCLQASSRDSC